MAALPRALSAAAGVAAACVAYGTFVERRWYRLRHVRLPGALRADGGRPLRILHVSDLHLDPPQPHKVAFVQALADAGADLVAITGDVLGATGAEDAAVEMLAPLTDGGTPGMVVLGSNDVYGPTVKSYHHYVTDPDVRIHGEPLRTDRLVAGLEQAGFRVLGNQAARIATRRGPVAVGGIEDPHLEGTRLPRPDEVAVSAEGVTARVGLVHAPYRAALDLLAAAGYDLLLAGHTHGGQVRLPGVGALVGNCDLPLDQIRGASRYAGGWLHVSPGLGTSRYAPFRFACRPEATVLELTR